MPYLIFYVGIDLNLYCRLITLKGFNSNTLERLMNSLVYMSIFQHAERIAEESHLQERYEFYQFAFWVGFTPFFLSRYKQNPTVDVSRLGSWITTREVFEHDNVTYDKFEELRK